MAANNYYSYGHTHSGPQYSSQPTQYTASTAYTGQAAQYVPAQSVNTAPAFATQTSAQAVAPTGYAFAPRAQVVQAATAYDNRNKTFYTTTSLPTSVYTPAVVQHADSVPYQTFITGAVNPDKAISSQARSSTSVQPSLQNVAYQANIIPNPKSTYDAAVYSAAANYQPPRHQHNQAAKMSNNWNRNSPNYRGKNNTGQPRTPVTIHYCEVCKVSCAGPMTYKEHLAGSKHIKKEASNARLAKIANNAAALTAVVNGNKSSDGTTSSAVTQAISVITGSPINLPINLRNSASSSSNAASVRYRAHSHNQALAQLKCELCEIICTGVDAYASHVRGTKHQKVLKLHKKMGKTIPNEAPTVLDRAGNPIDDEAMQTIAVCKINNVAAKTNIVTPDGKVLPNQRINFISGNTLNTTKPEPKPEEKPSPIVIKTSNTTATTTTAATPTSTTQNNTAKVAARDVNIDGSDAREITEVKPVGDEYLETITNELGIAISFHCKLCECKFNDPNAKLMHTKGRRHRLAYKKKVDPSLYVESKPSEMNDRKRNRRSARDDNRDGREIRDPNYSCRMNYMNYHIPSPQININALRKQEYQDDRHVMVKHSSLAPTEQEQRNIIKIVTTCENALKNVSNYIHTITVAVIKIPVEDAKKEDTEPEDDEEDATVAADTTEEEVVVVEDREDGPQIIKVEVEDDDLIYDPDDVPAKITSELVKESEEVTVVDKIVKGVVRVGCLQKNLILKGETDFQLVVMCSIKPTQHLLSLVSDNLPKQLATIDPESSFEINKLHDSIVVSTLSSPKLNCQIYFTSPAMRSDEEMLKPAHVMADTEDKSDVLPTDTCREMLAQLRHNKWFQARVNSKPYSVIIRVMKDLRNRVKRWQAMSKWSLELLIRNVLSGPYVNLSPSHALRRIFECVAAGILLPGGPGIKDPCELENINAISKLTRQECEDITCSAQHALRMCALNQIYKVLAMDKLETQATKSNGATAGGRDLNRKRHLSTDAKDAAAEEEAVSKSIKEIKIEKKEDN